MFVVVFLVIIDSIIDAFVVVMGWAVGHYVGPETQFKLVAVDRSRVINVPVKLFQRLSMPTC